MFIVVVLSLFAVEPAAQTNAVCSADNLPSMIECFFQLTTALGIVGLAVVWQADSLIEMFTTVAGSMMNLPLAQCVDHGPAETQR